jgi:hypothetical protein
METQALPTLVLAADPTLPDFLLGRLASLLARQIAAVSPTMRKALGQDVLEAFLDCLDLGLAVQASAIMDQVIGTIDSGERLVA